MRTIEISVGAFVLAGILALVFLAFRVSGVGVGDTSGTYMLIAKFDDVAGLRLRSKVSMAGVTIGRVAKIGVDSAMGEAIVTMEITQGRQQSVGRYRRADPDRRIPRRSLHQPDPGRRGEAACTTATRSRRRRARSVLENLIGDFLTKIGIRNDA